MGQPKHTHGPWQVLLEECDKPYVRIRGTALGGRYKIANVHTPIYEGVQQREAEETRANARLIAAAPELLEALERAHMALVGYLPAHRNTFTGAAIEAAGAAIAKAREVQR